jgi:hypothetical protein
VPAQGSQLQLSSGGRTLEAGVMGRCYVHLGLQKCLQIAKSGPQETRNLRLLRRSADFCVVLRLRLCYSPFPDSHARGGVSLSNGEVLFEPSRDG